MAKSKKYGNIIIILVILLAISIYLYDVSKNGKSFYYENGEEDRDEDEDRLNKEDGFYYGDDLNPIEKLHWDHMPISFSFEDVRELGNGENIGEDIGEVENVSESERVNCQDYQIDRMREAFGVINNETDGFLFFEEVEDNGDIVINCNALKADDIFIISGHGVYTSRGYVIEKGELNFYTHINCGSWPDVEIHEILHVFGFNHADDKDSIMNPEQVRCDLGMIDDEIIKELRDIYG